MLKPMNKDLITKLAREIMDLAERDKALVLSRLEDLIGGILATAEQPKISVDRAAPGYDQTHTWLINGAQFRGTVAEASRIATDKMTPVVRSHVMTGGIIGQLSASVPTPPLPYVAGKFDRGPLLTVISLSKFDRSKGDGPHQWLGSWIELDLDATIVGDRIYFRRVA
jgi:hypothetical protein